MLYYLHIIFLVSSKQSRKCRFMKTTPPKFLCYKQNLELVQIIFFYVKIVLCTIHARLKKNHMLDLFFNKIKTCYETAFVVFLGNLALFLFSIFFFFFCFSY